MRLSLSSVAVLAGGASLIVASKGVPLGCNDGMWPFWKLTYQYGFQRRALVGALFQAFASGLADDVQRRLAMELHAATWLGLLALMIVALTRGARGLGERQKWFVLLGASAIGLSPFFACQLSLAGYFDGLLLLLVAAGSCLALRGRIVAASALVAIGPFIHDGAVFLWLPAFLCAMRDVLTSGPRDDLPRDPRRLARATVLLLPFATEILTLAMHSQAALTRSIADMPPEWAGMVAFTFPLRDACLRMAYAFRTYPDSVALAVLWYCWPVGVTLWATQRLSGARWPASLWRGLVAAAPCLILAIAWDLWRFLLWMHFGAFVVLLWTVRDARRCVEGDADGAALSTTDGVRMGLAAGALLVFGIGGPLLGSYFDHAYAHYNVGGAWQRETPGAWLASRWVAFYNRRESVPGFATGPRCEVASGDVDPRCGVDVGALAPGKYVAEIRVAPAGCSRAEGELDVVPAWRLSSDRWWRTFEASEGTVSVPFAIDKELEAMGHLRVDVVARGGCLRVEAIEVRKRAGE